MGNYNYLVIFSSMLVFHTVPNKKMRPSILAQRSPEKTCGYIIIHPPCSTGFKVARNRRGSMQGVPSSFKLSPILRKQDRTASSRQQSQYGGHGGQHEAQSGAFQAV